MYIRQFKVYGNTDCLTGFTIKARDGIQGGKLCISQTGNFAISTLKLKSEIQLPLVKLLVSDLQFFFYLPIVFKQRIFNF